MQLTNDQLLGLCSIIATPAYVPKYAIWPDGTHCLVRYLEDYSEFMGDAYEIVDASELDRRLNATAL